MSSSFHSSFSSSFSFSSFSFAIESSTVARSSVPLERLSRARVARERLSRFVLAALDARDDGARVTSPGRRRARAGGAPAAGQYMHKSTSIPFEWASLRDAFG